MLPRFLSFIELLNLLDAAKIADEHLVSKITSEENAGIKNDLENARQSLLRSIFISAFAILEQNMDEFALIKGSNKNMKVLPKDLKDRGITRSFNYSVKVLGSDLKKNEEPWQTLFSLQKVRNHLVHYGHDFSDNNEHMNRFESFNKLDLITMNKGICFTIKQIEEIFELMMVCTNEFIASQNKNV